MHGLLAAMTMCLPAVAIAQVGDGVVELTGPGAGASEDFNTLASTGTTNTLLPTGWYFVEPGSNNQYVASDGSGDQLSGSVYSFGTEGSNDRALGSIASGSTAPIIGAQLRNASGNTISGLHIEFTMEHWRMGDAGAPDELRFAYSTNATSLTTGTWTRVDQLDAIAKVTTGSVGPLDGNAEENRTRVSHFIEGLVLANNATVWIRWNDYNDAGVDDGIAIDDVVFGIPGDAPPRVSSISPGSNAVDVPNDASIVVTFSETVDIDPLGISLTCDLINIAITVSTVVDETTITPVNPLADGAHCTLSILKEAVTDFADPAQEMEADYASSFTVFDPANNAAPEVASTVPAHGSSNFAPTATLSVTFTEAVVVTDQSFSLVCSTTQNVDLAVQAASGFSYNLVPDDFLEPGESCTLTVLSEYVFDLFGKPMVNDYQVTFTVATPAGPSTYYQNVNLSSPEQLRCTLHETIKGHTNLGYSWTVLEELDEDPNDSSKILDIYRNCSFTKVASRVGNGGAATTCGTTTNRRYNREHVWPRSYGFNDGSNNQSAHNDMHMLHLSDELYNENRGNKPFDTCVGPPAGSCQENRPITNNGDAGGDGTYPGNSNWYSSNDGSGGSYEVWHRQRGNMARAMFYMAMRYEGVPSPGTSNDNIPDLELTDDRSKIKTDPNGTQLKAYMGMLSTLLAWHAQDIVDDRERDRSELVFAKQGNRNPFVDHPEWASAALFNSTKPNSCTLNEYAPVAANDSYAVNQDQTLTITATEGVLDNDSDVEFDVAGSVPADWFTLTAARLTNPANGSLSLSSNGSFTYTPASGFCGSDSFTYRTSDGVRWSQPATVTITVGSDCGGEPELMDIFSDGFESKN